MFRIRSEARPNAVERDPTIWILEDDARANVLEVWPALGFNAFRWAASEEEMLFCDPLLFDDGRPSRSGFPILFPFPNRIRDGRYSWNGRDYVLPLNDPAGKNAIHGFVHVAHWKVVETHADQSRASITGEVRSEDLPGFAQKWPAGFVLRVNYTLRVDGLDVAIQLRNPAAEPLPWGLGFHPYFRVEADAEIECPATTHWDLVENLPTGAVAELPAHKDLRTAKRFAELQLDDLYGGVTGALGTIRTRGRRLEVTTSPDFIYAVLFTPPHREAICLEPYTCVTDAIHIADGGWRTLASGEEWSGFVRMQVFPSESPGMAIPGEAPAT